MVKFGNLGFSMGKSENSEFSETIAACDLKVGRCRQLIEFMKVCEYVSRRPFMYENQNMLSPETTILYKPFLTKFCI